MQEWFLSVFFSTSWDRVCSPEKPFFNFTFPWLRLYHGDVGVRGLLNITIRFRARRPYLVVGSWIPLASLKCGHPLVSNYIREHLESTQCLIRPDRDGYFWSFAQVYPLGIHILLDILQSLPSTVKSLFCNSDNSCLQNTSLILVSKRTQECHLPEVDSGSPWPNKRQTGGWHTPPAPPPKKITD